MSRWLSVSLCLLAGAPAMAADECLRFDNVETTTLTGLVYLKTFYGPPHYGEDPATDVLETQALLALDMPICVYVAGAGGEVAASDASEVTLVPGTGQRFKSLAGHRVSVTGSLFAPETAHHHTAVLVSVTSTPAVLR